MPFSRHGIMMDRKRVAYFCWSLAREALFLARCGYVPNLSATVHRVGGADASGGGGHCTPPSKTSYTRRKRVCYSYHWRYHPTMCSMSFNVDSLTENVPSTSSIVRTRHPFGIVAVLLETMEEVPQAEKGETRPSVFPSYQPLQPYLATGPGRRT